MRSMPWSAVGEPYDMVREGSRVRLMSGGEARVVKVRDRSRSLLSRRLSPPLFEVEIFRLGVTTLIHGNGIAEVLDE